MGGTYGMHGGNEKCIHSFGDCFFYLHKMSTKQCHHIRFSSQQVVFTEVFNSFPQLLQGPASKITLKWAMTTSLSILSSS
jgi:hypothetical protein